NHLVVTTQPPASVAAGSKITFKVAMDDASGHVDTTFTGPVTVALGANPGSATLLGTLTVNALLGVATFSTLSINTAASGYTLAATASGLPAVQSAAFNVTPAAPSLVLVTTQPPASVAAGAGFGLAVTVEDKYSNVETGYLG